MVLMREEIMELMSSENYEPRNTPLTIAVSEKLKERWDEANEFVRSRSGKKKSPLNKMVVDKLEKLIDEVLELKASQS